jgi:hypothetical protein
MSCRFHCCCRLHAKICAIGNGPANHPVNEFNAQIVAARAGQAGTEFAAAARSMTNVTNVTTEIDELVRAALDCSLGQ